MNKKSIGARMAQRRKALGLRMKDIAGDDFTVSFISQIESGKANASVTSLEKIARRLAVPMSFFFGQSKISTKISSRTVKGLLEDFFALDNLLRAKDYLKLSKLLTEIKNKLEDNDLSELVCLCEYYEGVVAFNQNDKLAAAAIISRVLPHLEDNAFPDKLVNCHNILARAHRQQNNIASAILGNQACLKIIEENSLNMPEIELGALLQLGELLLQENRVFEAYDVFHKVLTKALPERFPIHALRAHGGLAECYSRSNYPQKSFAHRSAAAKIAELLELDRDF